MTERQAATALLLREPAALGRALGFDRLTPLHNDWIRHMVGAREDRLLWIKIFQTCLT